MKYKFEIDGIGIQFETAYRKNLETGINYQIKKLLGFWHSNKNHAYILVYERNQHNEFGMQPNQIARVTKDGSYTMMTEEEWAIDRKKG